MNFQEIHEKSWSGGNGSALRAVSVFFFFVPFFLDKMNHSWLFWNASLLKKGESSPVHQATHCATIQQQLSSNTSLLLYSEVPTVFTSENVQLQLKALKTLLK